MKNKINVLCLFITTMICMALAFITLVSAAAIDEGTGGSGFITITLAKLFEIFRFPTHTLGVFNNGSMFFLGLFLNCLFYGFLSERFISFFFDKRR
jgi:hypothetical protein